MINLTINFSHPDAVSQRVKYARIDNVVNPTYITVSPDVITSPANIATNIPNGQYRIQSYPIYADGRDCSAAPTIVDTPACEGLISLNAYITGNTIVVQYLAPPSVPKVRITVAYPNGGSFTDNFVNNGNDIPINIPSNLQGDFLVYGQSVCDETSGFYSTFSPQVTVTKDDNNVTITNNATDFTITFVQGIAGFTLPNIVTTGNSAVGAHQAFAGSITIQYTGAAVNQSAILKLNGSQIQCVDIVGGNPIVFSSATFSNTDIITVEINDGNCP